MFYTYRQNNSGGFFIIDDEVNVYVIIEAASAAEADSIAQDKGIYFDGCESGMDCSCCGDRWIPATWEDDPTETPQIYGGPPSDFRDYVIYYLDGRVERFT